MRFHTGPIFVAREFSPFGERLYYTGCLVVSLILIAHLWIFHRDDKLGKKVLWSVFLLVPFLGWAMYGGFYNSFTDGPPGSND